MIAHGTPVGDYHTWVRPAGPDCPRCECCTVALCEIGATVLGGCAAHTSDGARVLVRGCPCSAASTQGTVAHAFALWHELVERESQSRPGVREQLHAMYVEQVLGSDTAQDPALVGPRLRELIAQVWPDESRVGP